MLPNSKVSTETNNGGGCGGGNGTCCSSNAATTNSSSTTNTATVVDIEDLLNKRNKEKDMANAKNTDAITSESEQTSEQ